MRRREIQLVAIASCLLASCSGSEAPVEKTAGGKAVAAVPGELHLVDFEDTSTGAIPSTFANVLGDWEVRDDGDAPSGGRVFAQTGTFEDADFPRIILKSLTFKDPDLSVKCRAEEGEVDQACGLMFRLQDSENYLITRANVLESNIRLYRVVDNEREEFESIDFDVTAAVWHTLAVKVRGNHVVVTWDGETVIESDDDTFPDAGKVGLWLKADAVTSFDDLQVTETAGAE